MANMLSRNKNPKPVKKTMEDHAEDALYREITEEVHAEKVYNFVKKNAKLLIAVAILVFVAVVSVQVIIHQNRKAHNAQAKLFETAVESATIGDLNAADEAFARAAAKTSGGMADLAMWESALMNLRAGKGTSKLEQLASDGTTRDFRDLARIRLATINGDNMKPAEFEKFINPVLTQRSPYYYTGMLLVAQKYLSVDDVNNANKWLNKIIGDKDAPAMISAMAESLR